ncbi:MAG: hypothetical protein J4F46_04640 [Dehalococcoidia bacterium]|nr:hypothetical protein [Dehalococcoidia bacterium]
MNIALRYNWTPVENVPDVPYHFPQEVSQHLRDSWRGPAIYRWIVFQQKPGNLQQFYVGETDLLHRRIYQYLNPRPTQLTNQSLNAGFKKELEDGRKVILEALCFEPFNLEDISISMADLTDKWVRRFLENLFIVYYSKSGYTVLNE